jgi:hypothetical protein
MSDTFSQQAKSDFSRARWKAFVRNVLASFKGEKNTLLSYDEVKEKLHIGGPIYRGVKTVPISQIVGSLNRYHEFDAAFLPKNDENAGRWQSVDRAFYQEVSLPPVVLYKVGEVYFVVDGHHRVSVAREQNAEFIDAEVRECSTKVNLNSGLKSEDLEILQDKVKFLEATGFDQLLPGADIFLTIPDGFSRMREHIAVHRYFMGLDEKRDITEGEAVLHWYETVYLPITRVSLENRKGTFICGCSTTRHTSTRRKEKTFKRRPTRPGDLSSTRTNEIEHALRSTRNTGMVTAIPVFL